MELTAFIEEAVEKSQCTFTLNSWRRMGWKSPLVKDCVISHFLKLENAQDAVTHHASPTHVQTQAIA